MELRYCRVEGELNAVLAFMEWQGKKPLVTKTPEVLRLTKGQATVLLFINGEMKAKGFYGITEYFKSAGLLYC